MALGPGGRKILKSELVAAKYLAMTTPEVLADLLIDIGKQRESITCAEIYNAVDTTEARALSADDRLDLRDLLALSGDIDISVGSKAKTYLIAAFPDGTTTFTALQGLFTVSWTRIQELGIVEPTLHEIDVAMDRYVEP